MAAVSLREGRGEGFKCSYNQIISLGKLIVFININLFFCHLKLNIALTITDSN